MKNKIVLTVLLSFLVIGFYIYKNKKSINQIATINDSFSEKESIENYLNKNILKPEFGGKVFCSFYKYGSSENENKIDYYLWAYCEEYYKSNEEIKMGSGVSIPVKLNAIINNNQMEIIDFEQPIDGEGYPKSIKDMFPEEYEKEAINGFDINKFTENPKTKAYEFYKTD